MSEVRDIKQIAGGYEVNYRDHRDDNKKTVSAPLVFLAGGTLGTTEILLRSRDKGGLKVTDKLGTHFSSNGDFGAFCVGTTKPVHSTRGPINTPGSTQSSMAYIYTWKMREFPKCSPRLPVPLSAYSTTS